MSIVEYPLIGYQPDLPKDIQGVIVTSSQILPTDRGIGNGWGATLETTATTTGISCGGAELYKLDATHRVFFGTATKLFEYTDGSPGATTDRSGGVYNAVTITQEWSFAQFGNVSLAINKGDTLQQINAGATFAAVATAPKASIVVTPGLPNASFVMLFDYNDGTNNYQDGIFWSGLGDYTNWTTSIAAQCGNIRLTDINGPFTAAIAYRNGVVAFKATSMYLGTYVGGSDQWDWTRISGNVGCIGKNALCIADDSVYFADSAGIWVYDGSYPRPVTGAVHAFWASVVNTQARLVWDKVNHQLWCAYNRDGTFGGQHMVHNLRSGMWTSYGALSNGTDLADHLISGDYALKLNATTSAVLLIAKTSANSQSSKFKVGAHGNPYRTSTITSVRPNWNKGDLDTSTTWCTAIVYRGPSLRNVTSANVSFSTGAPGRFDGLVSDRFLQPEISVNTAYQWELVGMAVDVRDGGLE